MIVTSGQVTLTDVTGAKSAATVAVLPVGAPHSIRGILATSLLVYVDPECAAGRALGDRLATRPEPLSVSTWIDVGAPLSGLARDRAAEPGALADAALQLLLPGVPAPWTVDVRHPVLRKAVALLPGMLESRARLTDLADEVRLSPDRLGRLFAEELGMSFPAYLRWARMRKAIEATRDGATLTSAAHAAGFTDSAHLNRVFRQMFGLSPAQVARRVQAWS